jgi:tripartite-type tricarboxylate transporter receptor subunit TctC
MKSTAAFLLIVVLLALGLSTESQAQVVFTRPVRIIHTYAPGSGAEEISRFLASKFSERINQPVVVESISGAGGVIGTRAALKAQPSGYTLLLSLNAVVTNTFGYKNPGYTLDDFAVIGPAGIAEYALVVNTKAVPVRTLAELIAYARANPGKLNYGSLGPAAGNSILMERFKQAAEVDIMAIPYKGAAETIPALLAGQVHVNLGVVSTSKVRMQNPQIVGLAVTGEQRSRALPAVPTFKEQGFPSMSGAAYLQALLIAKSAPREMVERYQGLMGDINHSSDMKSRLERLGLEPWEGSRAEFEAYLKHYAEVMAAEFKRLGIRQLD